MKYRIFDSKEHKYDITKDICLDPDGKLVSRRGILVNPGRYDIEFGTDDVWGSSLTLFENDIIVCDCYPFYDESLLNYVGVVVKDTAFGYELVKVSGRVRGGACGDHFDGNEMPTIRVIGNARLNPELLEVKISEEK